MNAPECSRVAESLAQTFRPEPGRYLLERFGKASWSQSDLTPRAIRDHADGRSRIGFKFNPERLAWAVFDLDGKKHPEGRAWSLMTAKKIIRALADLGIVAILEQSRSGSGYHVWIIFGADGPSLVHAREFAAALLRTLDLVDDFSEREGVPGFYPWPAADGGCGRVPFLPLFGIANGNASGLLCDADTGEPFEDQLAALDRIDRTSAGVFESALEMVRILAPAPPRQERSKVEPRPFTGELTAYAKKALDDEVGRVAAAAPNDRHRALIAAAIALGELVAGGELPDTLVEDRLRAACTTNGMLPGREREFDRAIRDGRAKGLLHPRRGDPQRKPSTSTTPVETIAVDVPVEPEGFFDEQNHGGVGDVSDYHATDLGNARRFVAMHRDLIRYVPALRLWLCWDGRCWRRDSLGAVYQLARKTVAAMYAEAAKEEDADKRRKLIVFALGSESEKRLQSMVSLAETEEGIAIHEHDLDRDPWLLNVANGTLDLRTGELRDPNPADLISYALDLAYDPDARCPLWLSFLARIFNCNDELHAFVQRAMGYTLTGATREQVFFLLYGTGKNGKTVFIETVRSVLGDFARMARFESFLVKRGDQIPSDIARLKGARFVTAVETQDGRRLDEAMVKQLTGGDTVTARFHYKGEFEFKPTFKLFLTSNYKPEIQGQDLAIWRRVKLIPFTVTIPEEERDLDLGKKLRDELPGVLAWMVQGALLWQENGLGSCDAVEEHTRQYQSEQDKVGRWLDENCEFSKLAEVSKKDLYAEYKKTTDEAGERPLSGKKFSKRMLDLHPEVRDDRVHGGKWIWLGVKLAC